MAKHNYSQYSNNKKNPTTETETKDIIVEDVSVETKAPEVKMEVESKDTTKTTKPAVMHETVETKEVPKIVTGTVANCAKLNVRTKPSLTADVVTVVDAGTKLTINIDKSNREWLCVATDNGDKGYCMKKFVAAKL